MESKIKWQTGEPKEGGNYLITTDSGRITTDLWRIFPNRRTWEYRNKIEVKAWCKLSDIEPYKEETMEEELMPKIDFSKYCKDKYLLDMGDYEIKEEDGKTYVVRKKLQYQKTYEECCETLNVINTEIPYIILSQLGKPITSLAKLIVCRDAYWKIAGEQMGLGKPWKPDWNDNSTFKYGIICKRCNIIMYSYSTLNCILAFPTAEIRDAFYGNFKDLIEACKEFL